MNRKFFGLLGTALLVASAGCSMCQAPYDYCAATIGRDGQPTGGFMTRQGSVLGGMPGGQTYQSEPTLASPPVAQGPPAAVEATPVIANGEPVAADMP